MNNTNVKVDFRIMGDKYDVQEITRLLNVTPTMTWKTGDFIRNTKKKRPYTAWIYSTDVEETLDINSQLIKIENLFCPKVEELLFLKQKYNLDFSIDIVIIIENHLSPATYLENSIIKFASCLEARFDIDLYIN